MHGSSISCPRGDPIGRLEYSCTCAVNIVKKAFGRARSGFPPEDSMTLKPDIHTKISLIGKQKRV